MPENQNEMKILLNKVPQVTIFFWIIKILCTTVGETFADFINFKIESFAKLCKKKRR